MKFRHFEFRLFPKLKSKRKKKQKKCGNPDFPRDIGRDKNFNFSNPGYYSCYDNLGADDTITSASKNIYSDVVCTTGSGCYECSCSCYTTYPLPELTISVDDAAGSCDCSASEIETFGHSHVTCLTSGGERSAAVTPDTPSTIPRTRTRIKTNPWLPSPRTTPAPSPTDTANSIVIAATELTIPYRYPMSFDDSAEDNIPNFGPSRAELFLELGPEALNGKSDTFNIKLTDATGPNSRENTIPRLNDKAENGKLPVIEAGAASEPEVDYFKDGEQEDTIKTVLTLSNFTYAQFLTYDSSAASTPVTEGYRSIGQASSNIPEFEYESKTNELLESASSPRDDSFETVIGSVMAKQSENAKVFVDLEINCMKSLSRQESSRESLEGAVLKSDGGSTGQETDDLSAEEGALSTADWTTCESNMQTSTDTGYCSISRDTDSISRDSMSRDTDSITSADLVLESVENKSEDGLEWDNEPSAHNLLYNFYQEKRQLLMTRSLFTEKEIISNHKRSRSLADIEMSLDEKVSRLRAEKLYVQLKIREAIGEEITRRRQLRVFRSVSPDNRKDLLVKTLHDLKSRLENQSARLQSSYDTVLSLQRRFSERRSTPKFIETSI